MIRFFIPGAPQPTQTGSTVRTKDGRTFPIRRHSEYSAFCRLVASQHAPEVPMDGALRLRLDFYLSRPKTQARRRYPYKRPDLDNLEKGLLDALTKAGIWYDDAQVVWKITTKEYTDTEPGVNVRVEILA